MKIIFIISAFITLLSAYSTYPKIYTQQGTPLFKAVEQLNTLQTFSSLKPEIDVYQVLADKTITLGYQTDQDASKSKEYLKALRSLQKEYDKLIYVIQQQLDKAMKDNDHDSFKKIVEKTFTLFFVNSSFKSKLIDYYQSNCPKHSIVVLNRYIEQNKNIVNVYNTSTRESTYTWNAIGVTSPKSKAKVIVISSPTCKYCKKAKQLLSNKGIAFQEFDSQSSEGRSIFQKNHGSGVPLILIGDEVLRGYSKKSIIAALEKESLL
jgi:glutaredoxin